MKDKIIKFLGWICFISLIFQIISGLWPNISMFLFKGKVIFPNIFFKFSFLISLFVIFAVRKKMIAGNLFYQYLIFVGYLFFEFIYFFFYLGYDFKMILFGYNIYYFWLICIVFLPSLGGIISEKQIIKTFLILFIPSAIFGMLQNYYNSPILAVKSLDEYYESLVWGFYGRVRAFSLFGVSLGFAIFSSIISLIFLNFLFKSNKVLFKLLFLLFFLISVFCVWVTYSRTGYLFFIFSLFSFFVINFLNYKNLIRKLPIIYFILGLLMVIILFIFSLNELNKDWFIKYKIQMNEYFAMLSKDKFDKVDFRDYKIDSSSANFTFFQLSKVTAKELPKVTAKDSFVMRLIEWDLTYDLITKDIRTFLFGKGIYYTNRIDNKGINNFATDNLYLDILIHTGFFGFIILFYFLWKIWVYILENYSNSDFGKVIISVISALGVTNFTSNIIFVYSLLTCFCFFINKESERMNSEKSDLH